MNKRVKFVLVLLGFFALLMGAVSLVGAGIWARLDAQQREAAAALLRDNVALLVTGAAGLLLVLGLVLQPLFALYVHAPLELADGTRIVLEANPSHRLPPAGSAELQELARAINALASRNEDLQRNVDDRIREAQAKLQEEKNRLAALISELTQSVLVCNLEGRILLYNERAAQLFGQRRDRGSAIGGASLVGLGRSVFVLVDRSLIAHALESVQARLRKGEANPIARFVTATPGGRLARAQLTAVRGAGESGADGDRVAGFVLLVEDVTEAAETGSRKGALLQAFTEGMRRGLANMRAAVETLRAYPEMGADKQSQFIRVIGEEAAGLSAKLEETVAAYAASPGTEWLLEEMLGADLLAAACRTVESTLGVRVRVEAAEPTPWLRVDSYALVQAITAIARRLRAEEGAREMQLGLKGAGKLAHLDLTWSSRSLGGPAAWESLPIPGGDAGMTLRQVLERHESEIVHRIDRTAGTASLRLILPVARPRGPSLAVPVRQRGRPEYYDFDLFHQPGQTPELDDRKLSDLAYTVFDTETTGLQPSGGDEIIAIGAVRIVNGRVLHHESFEQFVDPGRSVPSEATRITGIDAAMVAGQPRIGEVLPQFHRFCEDTVLVAHNAAFDMRFLQLYEPRTGIKFTQPVLDTLLLAAVIHPNLDDISLEAIAARFGIGVIGRHTAVGDAIMTAEAFLKMIPLLGAKGILTFREAREASERTYYARLKY